MASMRVGGLLSVCALSAVLALPAAASAHDLSAASGAAAFASAVAPAGEAFRAVMVPGEPPTATSPLGRGINAAAPNGPCTDAARRGMPDDQGHDHSKVSEHRGLQCGFDVRDFLPLVEELRSEPDVVLGEMDVKQDIAAVSVTFPVGGALFFDVSDPSKPRFLSWYKASRCEGTAIANNCGAFIDLSTDGKTAFIAQQSLTFVPGGDPDAADDPNATPTTSPGVEVVDLRDPAKPTRQQVLPILSQGGVHTARSHVIPAEGSSEGGSRAPGEYVFSVANASLTSSAAGGIDIARFDRSRGPAALTPLSRIEIGETHDTFLDNDPNGRTYLYIAGGYSNGFLVYDVTNPAQPRRLARWDLTPECTRDWYSHTIDIAHRGGRRFVTMPAEVFTSGAQSAAAQSMGCGKVAGNGDQPGPLWIVDATDFAKLGQGPDSNEVVKQKSNDSLVASWSNPAGREAQNLTFSPHNQQVVGDRIYLSDYHGGVFVLDASGAFAGRQERPSEVAHIVPSGEPSDTAVRPFVQPAPPGIAVPRSRGRSSIWDMFFYKGCVLAADQVGGFYSLEASGDSCGRATGAPLPPASGTPPVNPPSAGASRSLGRRFLVSRRAFALTSRGVARVRVSCRSTSPCRGILRLRAARRGRRGAAIVGRRSFTIAGRRRGLVAVPLTAGGRRLVNSQGTARLLAIVNLRPEAQGGRPRTVTTSFRVVRPRGAGRASR